MNAKNVVSFFAKKKALKQGFAQQMALWDLCWNNRGCAFLFSFFLQDAATPSARAAEKLGRKRQSEWRGAVGGGQKGRKVLGLSHFLILIVSWFMRLPVCLILGSSPLRDLISFSLPPLPLQFFGVGWGHFFFLFCWP